MDFSSCLDFPEGTTVSDKRTACAPEVYRYRWPNKNVGRSHTYRGTGACHELEIYPDDRLVCAGLMATPVFDMSGAFDDNGTPADYTDDKPNGTPLPCNRRPTSTAAAPFETEAMVVDCVNGQADADPEAESLQVDDWIALGAPSLEGVEHLGTYHHMGFEDQAGNNFEPAYDSTEDIFVAHEAELTQSGDFVLVTDERGGGVLPVGASCSPGADNLLGNGGIHAFRVDQLSKDFPVAEGAEDAEAEAAVQAYQERVYAQSSEGERAIYRTEINTEPQGAVCTSHVFQQIPGQNRIFMAWYSQGTRVVDFTENPDGTIDFETAAYFVPENANEWTSHVFKVETNPDGSFTYWGAAADFALADAGRNAVDIYKVTLPAPPKPSGEPLAGTPTFPPGDDASACASAAGFDAVRARTVKKRKRVRFTFQRRGEDRARVEIYRWTKGKRRKIRRRQATEYRGRESTVTWNGRGARKFRNGYFMARFTVSAPNGREDVRHIGLRKKRGRFFVLPAFDRRSTCAFVNYYSLRRPVFGGKNRKALKVIVRLSESGSGSIEVRNRKGKLVKRVNSRALKAGKNKIKIRLPRKAKRGAYDVTLKAERPGHGSELTLRSRRL